MLEEEDGANAVTSLRQATAEIAERTTVRLFDSIIEQCGKKDNGFEQKLVI